ncbi:MAG: cysteine desulfurase [Bradymonadia bacterium]|jgi:cysteine desulfurase
MSIYLDHNASAPLDSAVADAMRAWLDVESGNPSSVHRWGRRARAAVELARRQVAQALGVVPGELIFTSGATEALHVAIAGLVPPGGHVVVSAVEHPAVFGACRAIGAEVTAVGVDAAGRIDAGAVGAAVRPDTALVVVMAAQNEIGVCQPIAAIAAALTAPLLCDVVQLVGRAPVSLLELGCAAAVISGHKIGGPKGVGALWLSPGFALRPWLAGGPQERGRRAGTENVLGIVGLGVAATRVPDRVAAMTRLAQLRDAFEAGLGAISGAVVHGAGAPRLANTSAFRFEGVPGDLLLAALDLEGYCLSSGSACSAGSIEPSPTLRALGLDDATAREGLRLSMGPSTTAAEVAGCLAALPALVARVRAQGACA